MELKFPKKWRESLSLKIRLLKKVDSTNDYLKLYETNFAVVADFQEKGKGRNGRTWKSEEGKGLYMSVSLPKPKKFLTLASLCCGVAVVKVLKKYSNEFTLKWPNDIYLNGKKAGGILVETTKNKIIYGIGINLYYKRHELQNLEHQATSLIEEGIRTNRSILAMEIAHAVKFYHQKLERGEFQIGEFEKHCFIIGKKIKVIKRNCTIEGKALGVDAEGFLVVETSNGKIERIFTDASVRLA